MTDSQHAVERGIILRILLAHARRERKPGDDISTYCAEPLIQTTARNQAFPMLIETVRDHLYYMRDKGLCKFHEVKSGPKVVGLMWRLEAKGTDLIEGNIDPIPGIEL